MVQQTTRKNLARLVSLYSRISYLLGGTHYHEFFFGRELFLLSAEHLASYFNYRVYWSDDGGLALSEAHERFGADISPYFSTARESLYRR